MSSQFRSPILEPDAHVSPRRRTAQDVGLNFACYLTVVLAVASGFIALSALLGGSMGLSAGIGYSGIATILSVPGAVLSALVLLAIHRRSPRTRLILGALAGGLTSAMAMGIIMAIILANIASDPTPYMTDRRPLALFFVGFAGVAGLAACAVTVALRNLAATAGRRGETTPRSPFRPPATVKT